MVASEKVGNAAASMRTSMMIYGTRRCKLATKTDGEWRPTVEAVGPFWHVASFAAARQSRRVRVEADIPAQLGTVVFFH
jgi:hypothetical protein